jgi:type IV pilus assembly protein PilW
MISITLGLLVVGAATALLLSTKAGYTAQDEGSRIQDTGNYAIEIISRSIRQTAYIDWHEGDPPVSPDAPGIVGYDAARMTGNATDASGIDTPLTDQVVNGSDVLAMRFMGSGMGGNGDGSIIDCGGWGIPAASSPDQYGMSIFYVAKSSSGEPELYCRARGGNKWVSYSIARGIESFQVLYGVDTDGDSLPNQFMTATTIRAMGDEQVWKKVVAVKLALLVRGSQAARDDAMTTVYDLFGKDYGDTYAATDTGTRISESSLGQSTRNKVRKVFAATIQLRNQAGSL